MKLLANEYRSRTIANIITGCSVVLFAILLYRVDEVFAFISKLVSVLFPFSIGFVLAFLLDQPMRALEWLFHKAFDRFFKKRKPLHVLFRIVAAVIMYAALIGLIIGFLAVVLPQLVDSIRRLIISVTRYLNLHRPEIERFLKDFNWSSSGNTSSNLFNSLISYWDDFAAKSLSYTGQLLVGIVNVSTSVGSVVSQLFIGMIISIYMLFGKEKFAAQTKKVGCAIMPTQKVETLTFWFRRTHKVFSSYIVGQLLASLVIGVVCYVVMLSLRIDYALLISVIITVTNIVPVFGPIVGAIIGILILIIVNPTDPSHALKFAASILVLQQLEGNVIAPRILGDSIGISSFWIILSIICGGGLFGLPGILLGIPVFALIYSVAQALVADKLKNKGMPPDTSAYYQVDALPKRETPPDPASPEGDA